MRQSAANFNPSKNPTLSDVAIAAGVATVTVSRYLNHRALVAQPAAKRISAAIKKLGYVPNVAARMLMGQPSNAVGLIVPSLDDRFFATVAQSVQEAARERGLLTWVSDSNSDSTIETSIINQMTQHGVDGILLIPSPGSVFIDRFEGKPPVVTIDRPLKSSGSDAVVVENQQASFEAVNHILSHGATRVICIRDTEEEIYTTLERVRGYEAAMKGRALRSRVLTLKSNTKAEVLSQLSPILRELPRVQAIFTTNNVSTFHALEALRFLNVQIPDDIAIMGFDDCDFASILPSPLSVVRQPAAELGKRALRLLLDRIGSSDPHTPITITLPCELVLRGSCGCAYLENDHDPKQTSTSKKGFAGGTLDPVRRKGSGGKFNLVKATT
jgi:LacI family transcriptional regulator